MQKFCLFVVLLSSVLLRATAQSTLPAPFIMSSDHFTLSSYSSTVFPANMAIGTELNESDGNFTTDIIQNASNGSLVGNWRAEASDGISYQAGSNNHRGAFLLRLNATGRSNIQVSWVVKLMGTAGNNINCIELQWKNGASGAWNNVGNDLYQQGTTASGTAFSITLPAAAQNVADLRLRWIYYEIISGSRSRLAIDDISVLSSGGTDHFRSNVPAGDWSSPGTWQTSVDGISDWMTASSAPDFNANVITIRNGHKVNITSDVTIDQTVVEIGGALDVFPGSSVEFNNGTGEELMVDGSCTLRSDNSGDARLGNTNGGTIAGNITVERYIAAAGRRGWRLLGSCMNASGGGPTIFNAWQEGTHATAATGYGTCITGPDYAPGNGYDAASPGSSLRYWNGSNLVAPSNTNATLLADNGGAYFLFARGDKSIINGTGSSNTTLRATGTVNQNTLTNIGVAGASYSLIPNPYPSPIDVEMIHAAYPTLNTFYVWDARLGTAGAYRTIERTGAAAYQQTPGNGPAAADNTARYIRSGQAFFIPGTAQANGAGQLTLTENMKTRDVPSFNTFKTTNAVEGLAINLNIVSAAGIRTTDGIRLQFDAAYSTAVTTEDVKKLGNFNENLGISNDNTILAVERLPRPVSNDTVLLKLWNTGIKNYSLSFFPDNLSSLQAVYLLDDYLGTSTQLDMVNTTDHSFMISADPASADPDRFRIVLVPSPVLSAVNVNLKAAATMKEVALVWTVKDEAGWLHYEVERAVNAKDFICIHVAGAGSGEAYRYADQEALPGNNYYRVKCVRSDGMVKYTNVEKVLFKHEASSSIEIYPNPVENVVWVTLNELPEGRYLIQLCDRLGRKILNTPVDHPHRTNSYKINIDSHLPSGIYQLCVACPGNGLKLTKQLTVHQAR